jgi:hypothetical protein
MIMGIQATARRLLAASLLALALLGMPAAHADVRPGPWRTLARLEPSVGCLAGVNLGWEAQAPAGFNAATGWDHCVFVDFTEFPRDDGYAGLDPRLEQVREVGGIYLATLEPFGGLATVTAEACAEFAAWCAAWNARGVPVFVRFAHEMNGDWYAWRMRPALYREKFRLLAESIHAQASETAMVWAPNEATAYPFGAFAGMSRAVYLADHGTEADWDLLDTNADDILDNPGVLNDHPFAPFYPGDDVVDWVGMTVYHWGTAYPWLYNTLSEDRKLWAIITGNYDGPNGDRRWNPDFYAEYAAAKGKPMMIPESAAFFRPSLPVAPDPDWPPLQTSDELLIKSQWIDQLLALSGDTPQAMDIAENFPLLKCINWFNHFKREAEAGNDWVDWTVTGNADVTAAYLQGLRTMKAGRRHFLRADDLAGLVHGWNCSLSDWIAAGPPFQVGHSLENPYEGRGCLRIDFDNTAPSAAGSAIASLSALPDALTWASHDLAYLRVRVPRAAKALSLRLVMQSAGEGWDILGTVPCPADDAWHTLAFPYQWERHAASAWLNLYLVALLPDRGPVSFHLDALEVADAAGVPRLAQGSAFTVALADADLARRPALLAWFADVRRNAPGKARAKIAGWPRDGVKAGDPIPCLWTTAIPLHSQKALRTAWKNRQETMDWLAEDGSQQPLEVMLWIKGRGVPGGARELWHGRLQPPAIASATPDGGGVLTLVGSHFGRGPLAVSREYRDADGKIRQQRLKLLRPDDPSYLGADGRPAHMDAVSGDSQAKVVMPTADPRGAPTGAFVLRTRTGIAAIVPD